jgi:hypothetical protein
MNRIVVTSRVLVCAMCSFVVTLAATTASAQTTAAQTVLYGTTPGQDATLYRIDPLTGNGTPIGQILPSG